ncbi:response regulator [Vibrio sp. HN007]|uniref:response regulator n=1 Tax=Vibrio iocasae TaxID=3098914 RepID=UPI0035D3F407
MKTRVVIIEDDPAIAELHQKYLQQMNGIEIQGIATSVMEAKLLLEVYTPDLILLDVFLPDGTGLELLRALRQDGKESDVILITAARDVDTLQEAMRGGVVDYLLKPVMFPRLKATLETYLGKREKLSHTTDIDQAMVDKFLSTESASSETSSLPTKTVLPKGIDAVTLDKIRALFNSQDDFTADVAGEAIGASRTTARRYLEFLITNGELEADLSYGTVGRPERSYRKKRQAF